MTAIREPSNRIVEIIALISSATSSERLKRSFFQLNDDLARIDLAALAQIDPASLPADRSRAALVAAALAFRYEELGREPAPWLAAPELVAPNAVFLTHGLDDLIRAETPAVVGRHNVFIDRASLISF